MSALTFSHSEKANSITLIDHLKIQQACSDYLVAAKVVAQGACNHRFTLDGGDLFDFTGIPRKYLEWLEYFSHEMSCPLLSRPDFIQTADGPKLIDPNFSSCVGYVPEVAMLVNHLQIVQSIAPGEMLMNPGEALFYKISSQIFPAQAVLVIKLDSAQCSRTEKDLCIGCFLNTLSDIEFVCADLDALSVAPGGVSFKGRIFSHLFNTFNSPHLFSKWDEHTFLWELRRDGKVQFLDNPFESILCSKVVMAFLSEFIGEMPLPGPIKKRLARTLPWTRLVREASVVFAQQEWHLEDLLFQKREKLVLKLANSFQGINVCVGKFYDSREWDRLAAHALESSGWIVQEYLESPPVEVRVIRPGKLISTINGNGAINPYLVAGQVSGYLNHFILEESFHQNKPICKSGAGVVGTTAIKSEA